MQQAGTQIGCWGNNISYTGNRSQRREGGQDKGDDMMKQNLLVSIGGR